MLEQWDIIEFNISPSKGHEPKGRRPALVVSNAHFNLGTSMCLVCPITSTDNGFPLHLRIPPGHDTRGFVVVEQIRAFDLAARKAQLIERLESTELMEAITECIRSFV